MKHGESDVEWQIIRYTFKCFLEKIRKFDMSI